MSRIFDYAPEFDPAGRKLLRTDAQREEQDILLHLVRFDIPAVNGYSAAALYFVDYPQDVTHDGKVYTAFPFQFNSGMSMSSDGSIDATTLAVANPDRILMGYIDNYNGMRGTMVTVRTMYQKDLAQDGAYVEDYFTVDSYTANETVVTLSLIPATDLDIKLPRGRFTPNSCRFRYRDPVTCKYAGPLVDCEKTLAACTTHTTWVGGKLVGNEANFGGFPGVPSKLRHLVF